MAKNNPVQIVPNAPQTLAEIPGLGPIRIRALQKAGWNSLLALSKATVEQLTTIPGMSSIKAQQLLDYLAQFPKLTDGTVPKKPTTEEAPPPAKENPLAPLGAKVLRAIIDLLVELIGTEIRPRLLKELTESVQLAETVALKRPDITEEQQARLEGGLIGIQLQITDARGQGKWNKKMQGDLADNLMPFNEVIIEVLGI